MSRRAESDLEREGIICGAVLAAGELKRARRIMAVLPAPSALQDPVARAVLTLAADMLSRGDLPSAATVFTEGTAGNQSLFSAEDRERLRSWQIDGELTETEIVTIGKQLHRAARVRRIASTFKALGIALERGTDKVGNRFGPEEARPHFDQLVRDYNQAHAGGMRGGDAVRATRARYEQEKAEGRAAFTKSGIPLFDRIFSGYPHKMVYVLGAGGAGKSTFAATQLDLHQRLGLRSVFSSMEDNHEFLVIRHIAAMVGLKQVETYSGAFPDEAKAHEAEERLKERWKDLTILTKAHAHTLDAHLQLWAQLIVQDGASVFHLDNMTTTEHVLESRNDTTHAAAARSLAKIAAFCDTWHVTAFVYAHTKDAWFRETQGKEHPRLNDAADTGGGIAADRYARLGLGIWSVRAGEMRLTCIKNTAEGRLAIERKTIAVDVHADQGLFDPDSAREVNLAQERAIAIDQAEASKRARKDAESLRCKERDAAYAAQKKAKADALKAEALAKVPAQGELLHVDTPKERQ